MATVSPSDAPAEERKALRDLMGLLALPALWAGKPASTVLDVAAGAIARIVPVDAALAFVRLAHDRDPAWVLSLAGGPWRPLPPEWLGFQQACETAIQSDRGATVPSPKGPMTVLRFYMEAGAGDQRAWFASQDPGYPTLSQLAFMRAAVSLAVNGLNIAHAENERVEAMRAKDEFLAMLGHELRNPLAPIVTALGLIRLKGAGHLETEVELIDRQVHHLSRLVDDLLDVTRITRDRVDLKLEPVSLKLAILEAIETAAPLIEERHHRVTVAVDEVTGYVMGDPQRLRQIFANLLVNAAKYTPARGQLWVTGRQQDGSATIEVRDNGAGIDAALLPRVFDLFEQGRTTIDRAQGGLGIGLALVRKLTVLHHGTVTAHSEGPGRGATFTVRLPLAAAPLEAAPPAPAIAPIAVAARGRKVLLVDDNADALQTLGTLLDLFGFEVLTAGEASEALAKAPAFGPDALILDIGLPGMDGYQLASELRTLAGGKLREARFIALTGYGQESDKARASRAGFDQHLVKPVNIDELLAALEPSVHAQTRA